MGLNTGWVKNWLASALTLGALGFSMATAADELPQVQRYGDTEFMTGGIGMHQSQAMRTLADQYSLQILLLERDNGSNAYSAGEEVLIRDSSGNEVLRTIADGPILLVDLPAGAYTLTGLRHGQAITRAVMLRGDENATVTLVWPESHGEEGYSLR